MKYKVVKNKKVDGQERIITKYLIFPKRIGDEIRWLETATFKQILYNRCDYTCGTTWWEWNDVEWI